jgi:WD40 repeat protein
MEPISTETLLWYAGNNLGCVSFPDWQDIYRSEFFYRSGLGTMILNPKTKSLLTIFGCKQGENSRLRELATKSNPGKTIRVQTMIKDSTQSIFTTSITALCFTSDSQQAYACSFGGTIQSINLRTNKLCKIIYRPNRFNPRDQTCSGASMSVNSKELIILGDGCLTRMQLSNHRFTHTEEIHDGAIYSMALHSNGRIVVTGGRDRVIAITDLKKGKVLKKYEAIAGFPIVTVVWLPGEKNLLFVDENGIMKLIRMKDGSILHNFTSRHWITEAIIVTKDLRWILAVCAHDKRIKKFDVDTFE